MKKLNEKRIIPHFIAHKKFSLDPVVFEGELMEKFPKIMQRVMKTVHMAKRFYRKERKAPSDELKPASKEFWDEVVEKSKELGIGLIGFTPVEEKYMFTTDYMAGIEFLYDNAIVLGMEMDFDSINTAPEAPAGMESLRIYAELGDSTNKLSDFIRSKGYNAIACHPLGGPIIYPPMAVMAGLGEIGKPGMVISKKYGPRQRLSMIATNASPLPENPSHDLKIAQYCEKCGICAKECPEEAIHDQPIINDNGTSTRIDGEKCINYFNQHAGCSICIKVCPFNQLGYDRVMKNQ